MPSDVIEGEKRFIEVFQEGQKSRRLVIDNLRPCEQMPVKAVCVTVILMSAAEAGVALAAASSMITRRAVSRS